MADLSPVETLREAAAKLRARAKEAAPGPWRVVEHRGVTDEGWKQIVVETDEPGNSIEVCDVATVYADDPSGDGDAEWIALVHPGVAGPLADWLEHCYRTYRGWLTWPLEAQQAYAVARVLLGVPDGE